MPKADPMTRLMTIACIIFIGSVPADYLVLTSIGGILGNAS